jgi:hypothetical protein
MEYLNFYRLQQASAHSAEFLCPLLQYYIFSNLLQLCALGGLVVSVLATGPKVAGSNPAEEDGF